MAFRIIRFFDENPMPEMFMLAVNLVIGGCALVLSVINLLYPAGFFGVPVISYGHIEYIITGMLLLSFALAALVMLSCMVAMIWKEFRNAVLQFHSLAFGIAGVHLLAWAVTVLIQGTPEDTVSWFFGLMTMYLTYSMYLLRRTMLSGLVPHVFVVRYLHVLALAVALCLDIGLFLKAYGVFPLAARALAF